jgi:hypothetical protein
VPAKILDSQLQLTVTEQGARPNVHINNSVGHVICHLTQGFDPGTFPAEQGKALTAGAHVPLGNGPEGTTFGFVQLARANFFGAFYAGRIPSEGSIGVLASTPPALVNPLMLDASGNPPIPFFSDPAASSFIAPKMHSSWGDHPACRVPLTKKNSNRSNVDNYLFQVIDDREFWTIFTARDIDGTLRYLAHFHWKLRYEVDFTWSGGKAVLRRSKSGITVPERNGKGRPTEGDLQGLLTAPTGTRANVLFDLALRSAFNGGTGPNRSDNPRYFMRPVLPLDFWV